MMKPDRLACFHFTFPSQFTHRSSYKSFQQTIEDLLTISCYLLKRGIDELASWENTVVLAARKAYFCGCGRGEYSLQRTPLRVTSCVKSNKSEPLVRESILSQSHSLGLLFCQHSLLLRDIRHPSRCEAQVGHFISHHYSMLL